MGFCFCLSWWKTSKLGIDLLCRGTTDRQNPPQRYAFMCGSTCVSMWTVCQIACVCLWICISVVHSFQCVFFLTFVRLPHVFMYVGVCTIQLFTVVPPHMCELLCVQYMFCVFYSYLIACLFVFILMLLWCVLECFHSWHCVCTWTLCANVGMFLWLCMCLCMCA